MVTPPQPPARARRVADVQLRDPAPRARARVHWPLRAATTPPLVVVFADADAPAGTLVELLGAVVLVVSAAHAVEAHAAVAWAADHAAELGADPSRLALLGVGSGAALAERVAELAVEEGWPQLVVVAMVWPHDDPDPALDRLARALTPGLPQDRSSDRIAR